MKTLERRRQKQGVQVGGLQKSKKSVVLARTEAVAVNMQGCQVSRLMWFIAGATVSQTRPDLLQSAPLQTLLLELTDHLVWSVSCHNDYLRREKESQATKIVGT